MGGSDNWGLRHLPPPPPLPRKSWNLELGSASSNLGIKKRAVFVAFKNFSDHRRCCCICFFFINIIFIFINETQTDGDLALRLISPLRLSCFLPFRAHLLFYCQSDNLYSAPHQKFPTSKWCSIRSPCSRVVLGCDGLGGRMPKRQDNQLYPFENQFSPEATNSMKASLKCNDDGLTWRWA